MVNYDFSNVVLNKNELHNLKKLKNKGIAYQDDNDSYKSLVKNDMIKIAGDTIDDGYGGYDIKNKKLEITEKGLAYLKYKHDFFIHIRLPDIINLLIAFGALIVSIISIAIQLQ